MKPMKPSIRYYIPISHFSKQFSHILLASKFLPSLRVIHNSQYKFTSWHLFHLLSNSKSSSEFYVYIINVKPSIRYYISISTVLQTVFTFFSSPKILQNPPSVSFTILDTNLYYKFLCYELHLCKFTSSETGIISFPSPFKFQALARRIPRNQRETHESIDSSVITSPIIPITRRS